MPPQTHYIAAPAKLRNIALTVMTLLFIGPLFAYANPWIEVGDERARHHLNYLKDTGAINIPLNSWPVNWADVSRELADITLDELTAKQVWSYRYLRHAKDQADRPLKTTKRFYGSNSLIPFTHFASEAREQYYASSETTVLTDHFALNIDIQTVRKPTDNEKHRYDGSYIATQLGNWIIGAGALERWWGPGWQSSLTISNNARPTPGLFIRRNESFGSNLPVASLLGPWTLEVFANTLEKERAASRAKLLGARFTFMPLSFLEVGHSRTTLRGGNKTLTAADDTAEDASSNAKEEQAPYISYDARISIALGDASLAIYGQTLRQKVRRYKSEAGSAKRKAKSAKMAGAESGFSWGSVHNRIAVEYADTENKQATDDREIYSDLYTPPQYPTGFRHYGRAIGESAGTNAIKVSLLGDHYFESGHQLSWRFSSVKLNPSSNSTNFYSDSKLKQKMVEVFYKLPLSNIAQINAGIFYMDNKMVFSNKDINSGASIQLELRF